MTTHTPVIATQGHDGRLSIIVQARHVDIGDAPDPCPICGGTGEFEDEEGFWTDCPCRGTQPDTDAIMDAAIDERFALPAWEDARDAEREARPVPAGLGNLPF